MTKAEAGARGGKATAARYDMVERGRAGGRPPAITYSSLLASRNQNNKKGSLPCRLMRLERYKKEQGESDQ